MKPWKPRPFHLWPEELQNIHHLPDKKWVKALAKLFVMDEMQGRENIEKKQRLDKSQKNADNCYGG